MFRIPRDCICGKNDKFVFVAKNTANVEIVGTLDVEEKEIVFEYGTLESVGAGISYCPFCGKRL